MTHSTLSLVLEKDATKKSTCSSKRQIVNTNHDHLASLAGQSSKSFVNFVENIHEASFPIQIMMAKDS